MDNKTLSIIITAHQEGRIVEQTVESLFIAAKRLNNMGIEYDFLVNIDNGDTETKKSCKRYEYRDDFKVFETEFGDPGLARNSILRKTNNKYVALIDADDTISENWLESAMNRILKETGKVLIHPEAELRFDKEKIISLNLRVDAEKKYWLNVLSLFGGNRWCSIVLGERKFFLENQYSESAHGFGYEDYYFNCITTERKIRHLIAPGTTAFLLQKEKSITRKTHLSNDILPYVELFNLKKMKRYTKLFGFPKPFEKLDSTKIPGFVIAQAKNTNMDVVKFLNKKMNFDIGQDGIFEKYLVGIKFCEMIKKIGLKKIKKVLFLDNLVELNELKCKKGVLHVVVESENIDSRDGVINFKKYFGQSPYFIKDLILTRLIVQLRPQEIIVGQSEIINEWVDKHENYLVANNVKVVHLDELRSAID